MLRSILVFERWSDRISVETPAVLSFIIVFFVNSRRISRCGCFLFRGSSVGIVSCCGLGRPGFNLQARTIFFSPMLPDRLWGPHVLLSNGHRGVKWQKTTDVHKVPKSRMMELYLRFSICLQYVMLNLAKGQLYLSTSSIQNPFQSIIHSPSCKSTPYAAASDHGINYRPPLYHCAILIHYRPS
jgi:hypothetical protein